MSLYPITTDYHWPTFNKNATWVEGDWVEASGMGYGPFGFGTSVIMSDESCMVDSDFLDVPDPCQTNPINCTDGLSFSIWEKLVFEDNPLVNRKDLNPPKKYIVSTGAEYDPFTGRAFPGFSIYHQGVELVAVVSTGEEVWELRVEGQIHNDTWTNIGVRWEKPDFNDENTPIDKLGGLELYVNLERVGFSLMPEHTEAGSSSFDSMEGNYHIGGHYPPVMMVGCHYDHIAGKYSHFSGGEYDELALWSRFLTKNATHDETVFFFGGFENEFRDVNPYQFKALLNNADLQDDYEAEVANEILAAMLLPEKTTLPPIPTPTQGSGPKVGGVTVEPEETTTTPLPDQGTDEQQSKTQLALQNVMTTMLDTSKLKGIRNPEEVEIRFPLAIVANKIISGDDVNANKWQAVYDLHPHEEGAPKTIRELNHYMLDWVGATNTTYPKKTRYFDPETDSMKYATSGDDFVTNFQKLPPEVFRQSPRLEFPNYSGLEWFANRAKWDNPKDTYSIPTGMFKDQPNCNVNPVTFGATIYNELHKSMPRRRNMATIRGNDWQVDTKVVSVAVGVNVDPVDYDEEDLDDVAQCMPDPHYMKHNPIRAHLYHFTPGKARLTRRILATWFSEQDRKVGEIEVRHCVYWNENFGTNGAWDTTGCNLVETDANKTKCECEAIGSMAVILERSEEIDIVDDCSIMMAIKYVGIVISCLVLLAQVLVTVGSKYVWDMFHVLRMHVAINWICGVILHVITDMDEVRDDPVSNLAIGFLMMYFFTASATWVMLEAQCTFKAFTSGIISGRTKVYFPFGYGTPFIPLGILFLMYNDDLGIDPRCFVAWNDNAKLLYLGYNLGVCAMAVIYAIIIIFNIAKPQTKRRNVVSDLTSQAKGTVAACFAILFFWIFATVAYMHNQESDFRDPYCAFALCLGWFGLLLFIFLAACSQKFRYGIRGKKTVRAEIASHYVASNALENEDELACDDTIMTDDDAQSVSQQSRPATAVSQAPPSEDVESNHSEGEEPEAEPEAEEPENQDEEPQSEHDDNESPDENV